MTQTTLKRPLADGTEFAIPKTYEAEYSVASALDRNHAHGVASPSLHRSTSTPVEFLSTADDLRALRTLFDHHLKLQQVPAFRAWADRSSPSMPSPPNVAKDRSSLQPEFIMRSAPNIDSELEDCRRKHAELATLLQSWAADESDFDAEVDPPIEAALRTHSPRHFADS